MPSDFEDQVFLPLLLKSIARSHSLLTPQNYWVLLTKFSLQAIGFPNFLSSPSYISCCVRNMNHFSIKAVGSL